MLPQIMKLPSCVHRIIALLPRSLRCQIKKKNTKVLIHSWRAHVKKEFGLKDKQTQHSFPTLIAQLM